MTRVIVVCNHKGGVGKTTTALTLGAALAEHDKQVCLIGLDQQKNLELFSNTMPQLLPSLFFVKSSARGLKTKIEKLESKGADYVVIDCPPRLGSEVTHALRVADYVIVPLQAEAMVLKGLADILKVIEAARDPRREGTNPRLKHKMLLTKFDPKDADGIGMEKQLRQAFADAVFPNVISYDKAFNYAANRGRTILQFASKSRGAQVYRALAQEVLSQEALNAQE